MMQACNCTLPYMNPDACKNCTNNTQWNTYPINPKDWTYIPMTYPNKKIVETWEKNLHTIVETDGYGYEKTIIEEFDITGKMIKRVTEEKNAFPKVTYTYLNACGEESGKISFESTVS